jgi:hypothetical protein
MYRSNQFLAKVKATSTGKLIGCLHRNDVVAELCSGKFNVALSPPQPPYYGLKMTFGT